MPRPRLSRIDLLGFIVFLMILLLLIASSNPPQPLIYQGF